MFIFSFQSLRTLFLLSFVFVVHVHALAQIAKRPFPGLGVYELKSTSAVNWSELRPATAHVVLFLTAYEPNGDELLRVLSSSESYSGEGLNVFVQGNAEQADAYAKARQALLPKANWKRVNREAVAIAMRQGGTPRLHGVDAQGIEVWWFSGIPQPKEKALYMVRDWTLR